MQARHFLVVGLLLVLAVVAGCGSGTGVGSNPSPNGSSQVSVSIKDSPPVGVTVLSFEVTITGATLNPGNVSLVNSPIKIEVKRLETEAALLSTLNVPAGTYTSITVNFSNPELTFKSDTGATLAGCATGQVCEIKPNVAGSATFSGAPFPLMISANTQIGLLVDVNLANLISGSLGIDFTAANAIVVTQQTVATQDGEIEKIEDVKGQVTAKDVPNNQFTLQTAVGSLTIKVDSNTVFGDFGSVCSSATFACVAVNQIVEVDLSLQGGGALLAKKVELEDNDVNEAEVEGVIFAVDSATQFRMVALEEMPNITGLDVGNVVTVTLGSGTTFSVDAGDLSTSGFNFSSAADLLVGQNVQVRRTSTSSGTAVNADRVRLRASRFTATITGTVSAGGFTVNGLPSLFTSAGITQIQVQVSSQTEFEGVSGISGLVATNMVSLRGLLFKNGANPPVLIAGKVIKR
jgi:hypothetical protein